MFLATVFALSSAIALEQASDAQARANPQPTVPMEIAQQRVAAVKALLKAAIDDENSSFNALITPDARSFTDYETHPLTAGRVSSLRDCTRIAPFQVDETTVVIRWSCKSALYAADTTTQVVFEHDKIKEVRSSRTLYAPPPPPTTPAGKN